MAAIYALTWYFGTQAGAAGLPKAAALKADDIVNPINTMWVCVTAFLVFFMQAGFMMLEGGFARTRETSNVMMECIFDTGLCGMLFYAFGFAFMFGAGNGWIGYHYFFLQGVPHTYGATGIGFMAFFLFQFAFADTASTIVSGAMVGRTDFKGDIIYSFFVSGLIYPIFGHWIWGPNGVLATGDFLGMNGTPMRDFAGSTVVHTVGGVLALTGAIALGPRIGRKFKRDGGGMPPGHNMTLAALGGVILWFGWYGFNPGSTLSAMDFEGIGRVATNTTLAACAGALVAVMWVYPRSKKWDVGISINGLLAGLVAITAPCYWVSATGSIAIGVVAGVIMILAVDFTEWIRVDDPCGAFAVHGACGIWGTLVDRVVRHRRLREPGVRRQGPLLRRRHRPAGLPGDRQRVRDGVRPRRRTARHVRHQGASACSGSRPRASSRVSTSPSTARRRTTRSPRTTATRPSRRVPPMCRSVSPGPGYGNGAAHRPGRGRCRTELTDTARMPGGPAHASGPALLQFPAGHA